MRGVAEAGLALAMISAFLLSAAGLRWSLRRDRATRQRGLLMIAAAVVLVANVMIWTL